MGRPRISFSERMHQNAAYDHGCIMWTGRVDRDGYGFFSREWEGRATTVRTHRAAYEEQFGPIPNGMQIDHLCRNRRCCNPLHLEAVSPQGNTIRGASPSAHNAMATHCCRGHEFSVSNTRIDPASGARMCRQCDRDRWHRRQAARSH